MHIPDGFLDTKIWGSLAMASTAFVGLALKGKVERFSDQDVPVLGIVAAFIFAAQMVNFPVAGGTSGHFMGSMLAALLLGPWAATVIMSTVLVVQALVFQDGGLLALGANIFNMGLIAVWSGWLVYLLVGRLAQSAKGRRAAIFGGAWASIVLSAAAVAFELSLSGTVKIALALPAMAGIHALIGIGEGFVTLTVMEFVHRVRPDLFPVRGDGDG